MEGLSGALEGIEVRYRESPQDRITVARFVFWNAGTETLRDTDFTEYPLRITCVPDITILDHRIVAANDPTNKVEADLVQKGKDETSVSIRFDYLDPADGAIIQLVHDGREQTRFRLVGSLKGNCTIARSESPAYRTKRVFRSIPGFGEFLSSRSTGWLTSSTYLVMGVAALVAPFNGESWWFLALAPLGFLGAWVMYYVYVTGQVPSHFQRELGNLPAANNPLERKSP